MSIPYRCCCLTLNLLLVGCRETSQAPSIAQAQSAVHPAERDAPASASSPVANGGAPSGGLDQRSSSNVASLKGAHQSRRVLHLGDSMVPLVANYLRPALPANGVYETISTPSSTTLTWAEDARLVQGIDTVDPELVLVSLGSNEIFVRDASSHVAAAKRIVEKIGKRPCLWIGPPAWAKGYGFVDALAAAVAPCAFFHSEKLKLERQADGRHPTWSASYTWAKLVWRELGGTAL